MSARLFAPRIRGGGPENWACPRKDAERARPRHTHLRPDLEHVFKPDRSIGKLGLQHRDDVLVVLRDLLAACAGVQVGLREGLQLGDLRVERGDVLLDDIGEFLQ